MNIRIYTPHATVYPGLLGPEIENNMSTIPTYKFALREDLINKKEFLPTRAEPTATGWDVRAAIDYPLHIKPMEYVKIPLGFRAFCPEGWWVELKPRSSTFAKKHLHTLYGTIDEGFESEWLLAGQFIPHLWGGVQTELIIAPGEAIGQIIPVRRKEMVVEEVTNAKYDALCHVRGGQRGTGGFGSTSA